jgi:hypothetical protein
VRYAAMRRWYMLVALILDRVGRKLGRHSRVRARSHILLDLYVKFFLKITFEAYPNDGPNRRATKHTITDVPSVT